VDDGGCGVRKCSHFLAYERSSCGSTGLHVIDEKLG